MMAVRLFNPARERLEGAIRLAVKGANVGVRVLPGLPGGRPAPFWTVRVVRDEPVAPVVAPAEFMKVPSSRPIRYPETLADRIFGTLEGASLTHGGIELHPARLCGPGDGDADEGAYWDEVSSPETSALLAAWWTAGDGSKLVLVAGCVANVVREGAFGALIAIPTALSPRDLVLGYRLSGTGTVVGTLSHTPFAYTSRMPAADPTREALELAAAYGDPAARDALHDYKAERGLA